MTNSRGCQYLSFQKHSMLNCDRYQNSDSWLIFQIYFMSLNVKSITETARYSLATFIATIGGSMGAWVGFSVCMVFEVPSGDDMGKCETMSYKACLRDILERLWKDFGEILRTFWRHFEVTRPRPAFGRLGLGRSSGGFGSYGKPDPTCLMPRQCD